MKNIIGIILAISAVIGIQGCTDFLIEKPESIENQINFYNSPVRVNEGVMGCYAGMANVMKDEWMFTEDRSDNTSVSSTGTSSQVRVDICDMKFMRASSSLPLIKDFWFKLFQNISNVNSVLPSTLDSTLIPTKTQRQQYEGELLFIRAYHYFTLVNLWGDMFKVTSFIGTSDEADNAKKLTRLPVAEIYDSLIIPDLKKAANQLPASYPDEAGRITKWAAKSLLAKVYMQIGGAANLALAKPLLVEVLNTSGHLLLTDKGNATSAYANVFSTGNEMNKEIIFAIRYSGGALGIGSPFWGTFAPDGSQNIFLKIGTPGGNNNPTLEIMSLFDANGPKETRSDACFRRWIKGSKYLPYVSKYIDASMSQALQSENDWIVIRYADVELLYAEILAQGTTPDDARAEVNKIRVRAGLTAVTVAYASKTLALNAVYNERRLELAFEDQRWYDILRMNSAYNDPDKAITVLKGHTFTPSLDWATIYSKYKPILPPDVRFFTNEHLLLPIPQTEIDTNNDSIISQNPGY
ncbi:MAG: RagB/SusD family nutrient uptake outer membrane protein [Paludibacter sp.]